MSEDRSKKRPVSGDPSCSFDDGQMAIGHVFDRPGGCAATLQDRIPLGSFKDWKEARAAILEAWRALKQEAQS